MTWNRFGPNDLLPGSSKCVEILQLAIAWRPGRHSEDGSDVPACSGSSVTYRNAGSRRYDHPRSIPSALVSSGFETPRQPTWIDARQRGRMGKT